MLGNLCDNIFATKFTSAAIDVVHAFRVVGHVSARPSYRDCENTSFCLPGCGSLVTPKSSRMVPPGRGEKYACLRQHPYTTA